MIQVYTDSINAISQSFYNEVVFSLPLLEMECPCGEVGALIFYGFYDRKVKAGGELITLRIQRVRCRKCGKTHSILLTCLVPYSQIPLTDQQAIIINASLNGSVTNVADTNPLIDECDIRYVLRQFKKYWRDRLFSIGLAVTDALIFPCFQWFSMQFMQARNTPNILFHRQHSFP